MNNTVVMHPKDKSEIDSTYKDLIDYYLSNGYEVILSSDRYDSYMSVRHEVISRFAAKYGAVELNECICQGILPADAAEFYESQLDLARTRILDTKYDKTLTSIPSQYLISVGYLINKGKKLPQVTDLWSRYPIVHYQHTNMLPKNNLIIIKPQNYARTVSQYWMIGNIDDLTESAIKSSISDLKCAGKLLSQVADKIIYSDGCKKFNLYDMIEDLTNHE